MPHTSKLSRGTAVIWIKGKQDVNSPKQKVMGVVHMPLQHGETVIEIVEPGQKKIERVTVPNSELTLI